MTASRTPVAASQTPVTASPNPQHPPSVPYVSDPETLLRGLISCFFVFEKLLRGLGKLLSGICSRDLFEAIKGFVKGPCKCCFLSLKSYQVF